MRCDVLPRSVTVPACRRRRRYARPACSAMVADCRAAGLPWAGCAGAVRASLRPRRPRPTPRRDAPRILLVVPAGGPRLHPRPAAARPLALLPWGVFLLPVWRQRLYRAPRPGPRRHGAHAYALPAAARAGSPRCADRRRLPADLACGALRGPLFSARHLLGAVRGAGPGFGLARPPSG